MMSGISDHLFCVGAFMKACIVEDDIAFFVCDFKLAQRFPDGFPAHPETRRAFILIRIRIIPEVLRQRITEATPTENRSATS